MDLGLYLIASLFGTGYILNQTKQSRKEKHITAEMERAQPNGTDIYNSREFYKVQGDEAKRVIENWEASKDPITTGVIPMYYNTLHIKHDSEKVPNPAYEPYKILEVLSSLDENTQKLIKSKKNDP